MSTTVAAPRPGKNDRPAANTVATSRYEIGREIAHGGQGVVFEARDTVLNRTVAVKVLREGHAAGSAVARRFLDEASITGQLQHPGIPPVHDLGTLADGRLFLAMKLIKGQTLDAELKARPDPSHDRGRFLAAFDQLCQAVAYAHAHHVVHRDLKPANVMVGSYGEVQVMDWGLAKVLAHGEPLPVEATEHGAAESTAAMSEIESNRDDDSETKAGSVLGTPAYMPPEQAIGAIDEIDRRSDVFGLGAILCAILTGKPPFVAGDSESTRKLAARGSLEEACARIDGCGAEPELVDLCKRCLNPQRDARPADAGAVASAVATFRAESAERARVAELVRVKAEGERAAAEMRAAELRKRRRVQALLAAAVLVLAFAGGAFAWWQDRQRIDVRDRHARNAEAVEALLAECEASLRADDAAKAAVALDAAEKRMAEGGTDHLSDRLAAIRADVSALNALDEADAFRWTPLETSYPAAKDVVVRLRAAIASVGIDPGETPTDELAKRVAGSLVRDRLITALDLWLLMEPSDVILAALRVADADAYRNEIRQTVRTRDIPAFQKLTAQGEVKSQPPGFASVLGQNNTLPLDRRRELLTGAHFRWPTHLGLVMALGGTYLSDREDGVGERIRWYQAATVLAPRNTGALTGLGAALRDHGDLRGSLNPFREAVRLNPKQPYHHANLGISLSRLKDHTGAKASYNEAVRLAPTVAQYRWEQSMFLVDAGEIDEAVTASREAIRLEPARSRAHQALGHALFNKGDLNGSMAAYGEAIRLDPGNGAAHNDMGHVLRRQGDLRGATVAFRKALNSGLQQSAAVHIELGIVLRENGELDSAAFHFREAIHFAPKLAIAHGNLGITLFLKGDTDGAIACQREAIRLDPKLAAAHNELGLALQRKGLFDSAIASFQRVIAINPAFNPAHNNLRNALIAKGGLPEAEAYYRRTVKATPKFARHHAELGWVLWQKKDFAGAEAACRDAIRLDPNAVRGVSMLCVVLRDKGELKEAEEKGREAVRLAPDSAFPHIDLATVLQMKGDREGEIACYREAIRLEPRNATYHFELGVALYDTSDFRGAIASMQEVIRLNPKDGYARNTLGNALREMGDIPGAIDSFRQAIRLAPGFAFPRYNLGLLLESRGEPDEALALFREAVRLDPNKDAFHNALAWMLAAGPDGSRNGKLAVEHALKACALSGWKEPDILDTLAIAYAEAGDFAKAIEVQKKSLAFPEFEKTFGVQARKQLALFEKKQAYRDPTLVRRSIAPPPRPRSLRESRQPIR